MLACLDTSSRDVVLEHIRVGQGAAGDIPGMTRRSLAMKGERNKDGEDPIFHVRDSSLCTPCFMLMGTLPLIVLIVRPHPSFRGKKIVQSR